MLLRLRHDFVVSHCSSSVAAMERAWDELGSVLAIGARKVCHAAEESDNASDGHVGGPDGNVKPKEHRRNELQASRRHPRRRPRVQTTRLATTEVQITVDIAMRGETCRNLEGVLDCEHPSGIPT